MAELGRIVNGNRINSAAGAGSGREPDLITLVYRRRVRGYGQHALVARQLDQVDTLLRRQRRHYHRLYRIGIATLRGRWPGRSVRDLGRRVER